MDTTWSKLAHKMPPGAYARTEAMSDKLHAVYYNPFFLTDAEDAVAWYILVLSIVEALGLVSIYIEGSP